MAGNELNAFPQKRTPRRAHGRMCIGLIDWKKYLFTQVRNFEFCAHKLHLGIVTAAPFITFPRFSRQSSITDNLNYCFSNHAALLNSNIQH